MKNARTGKNIEIKVVKNLKFLKKEAEKLKGKTKKLKRTEFYYFLKNQTIKLI